MRTSFTSAISLPRFHDSCVPVCISFLISSVSSLGVCLLSSGACFWFHQFPHWVFASLNSEFSCFQVFFILFIFFIYYFFYPCLIPQFLAKGSPPPSVPNGRTPYGASLWPFPSVPFPNLTPLFWSFGSINAWWSALSRETQSYETIPASVTLSCIFYLVYLQFSWRFFLQRLQLFVLVFCFDDQVLSPSSSLATDFLGVVPVWRVAQKNFFQPCWRCIWICELNI